MTTHPHRIATQPEISSPYNSNPEYMYSLPRYIL